MEEALRFATRVATRAVRNVFSPNATEAKPVVWGRWCLPAFNPDCDQQLKGHFADADNSFCPRRRDPSRLSET